MRSAIHLRLFVNALLMIGIVGAKPVHGLGAEASGPLRRVLIVHSFGREFAPFGVMAATFRMELARQSAMPIEFHEASIEVARFQERVNEQPVVDYLKALFEQRRLDLIVATGGPAALFVNRHRQELFPSVPLIVTLDQRRVMESGATTNTAVVAHQLNLPGLVEDILQLLPATTNIAVVLGTSPLERYWTVQAQKDFARFTNRIHFAFLNQLSLDAMREYASALPPNSALLYGTLVMDAAGIPYEQEAALDALHTVANAPIFGVYEHQFGRGIVGGRLLSNETWGRRAADVALEILNGKPPEAIQSQPITPSAPVFDWRELKRWGIRNADLPLGSAVRFRQPTAWEAHRWQIMSGLAVTLVEAALIVLLAFNLTRRRRVERLLRDSITEQQRNAQEIQRLQVEAWHADRVARTGAITSSLAHELNQPLAAILSAAQAGVRFMASGTDDPREIRDILDNIVKDTKRASAVVTGVRAMLRRQTSQRERINLDETVRAVLDLLHSELLTRHVNLTLRCQTHCQVLADKTQIQQVVLNLVMNSIEAMQTLPDGERRLEVAAARNGDETAQVTVSDTGSGIPPQNTAKLFDAFWTTKPQGLGVGLSICRSIIESHRGRIWLAGSQPGQTTFCFTLPLDPGP